MKVEAVKVRRLYIEVATQIEAQLRNGSIRPGERLPSERDLAVRFEVSRPTIREAMIALEIAGLVEIRTGSGIYALEQNELSGAQLDDAPGPFEVLEARLLVEPEVVSLAAARISDEQLEILEQAIHTMDNSQASEKEKEQADERFHSFECLAG